MTDLPVPSRLDRAALERIIRRAAELQAYEREIGEGLTEDELMRLGDEVGIPPANLRQALLEERLRETAGADRGLAVWLAGPRSVAAQRVVAGGPERLLGAMNQWMTDDELLQVKRRFPDRTSWEPQRGALASIKRSFGAGGRQFVLAGASEVTAHVQPVDDVRCHVQLVADLRNTRGQHLTSAGIFGALGVGGTGLVLLLGLATPVAAVPAAVALPVALAILRARRRQLERFQVALEQVLDRLERNEIALETAPRHDGASFLKLAGEIRRSIADEIKKNL